MRKLRQCVGSQRGRAHDLFKFGLRQQMQRLAPIYISKLPRRQLGPFNGKAMGQRHISGIIVWPAERPHTQQQIAAVHQYAIAFVQLAGKAPRLVRAPLGPMFMLGSQAVAAAQKLAAVNVRKIAQLIPTQGDKTAGAPLFPHPVIVTYGYGPMAGFAQTILPFRNQPVAEEIEQIRRRQPIGRRYLQFAGQFLDQSL